jgi:hypothetical protein
MTPMCGYLLQVCDHLHDRRRCEMHIASGALHAAGEGDRGKNLKLTPFSRRIVQCIPL